MWKGREYPMTKHLGERNFLAFLTTLPFVYNHQKEDMGWAEGDWGLRTALGRFSDLTENSC